jgi:hypothetical protein
MPSLVDRFRLLESPVRPLSEFADLPGYELVQTGVADISAARRSTAAALTALGLARLRFLGVDVPEPPADKDPHETLWQLIEAEVGPDAAHARYNGLVARLVAFMQAVPCVSR